MNPIYAHYSLTNKQASVGDFLGFTPLNRSKEKAFTTQSYKLLRSM